MTGIYSINLVLVLMGPLGPVATKPLGPPLEVPATSIADCQRQAELISAKIVTGPGERVGARCEPRRQR
jgi:hypothetical protein